MLTLATLPSPSTFMSDIGSWSSPLFTDLLPFATLAIGITIGLGLLYFLVKVIGGLFGFGKNN